MGCLALCTSTTPLRLLQFNPKPTVEQFARGKDLAVSFCPTGLFLGGDSSKNSPERPDFSAM